MQTTTQQRAAQAVAAWLAQHERNTSWLAAEARVDPGTVGDFLNGKRWPKVGTQGKIEKALGWPAGSIRQITHGADPATISTRDSADSTESAEPDSTAMSTSELMAGMLRARAETDRLWIEVRQLAARVNRLEGGLRQGAPEESDDYEPVVERSWSGPTVREVLDHAAESAEALGMSVEEWFAAGRPSVASAQRPAALPRAARTVKRSTSRAHREQLDQVGEESQGEAPDAGA